jgi:integrase
MDRFESEDASRRAEKQPHSVVPLRGFCLIAYRTLVRPSNNFGLRWNELHLDPSGRSGRFKIERHKNAGRGLMLEGPLTRGLVAYLGSIMPDRSTGGLVHPNPATGKPFTSIRGSWRRLIAIANSVLSPQDQVAPDARFYTWRATGASELAATGADPVLVTKLMGDSSLRTVMRHYFDSSLDHMATALARWEAAGEGALATSPHPTDAQSGSLGAGRAGSPAETKERKR